MAEDIIMGKSCITLCIRASKTDQRRDGSFVCIQIDPTDLNCYSAILDYLKYRPDIQGPLFCHFDHSPLTIYQFNAVLKKTVCATGLDDSRYKSHSFRIGGASGMFNKGASVPEIKATGRWKSDAYKSYIR